MNSYNNAGSKRIRNRLENTDL